MTFSKTAYTFAVVCCLYQLAGCRLGRYSDMAGVSVHACFWPF